MNRKTLKKAFADPIPVMTGYVTLGIGFAASVLCLVIFGPESFLIPAMLSITALVTAGLRFLPFLVLGGKKESPPVILYLGRVLPGAIMAMLVVYCLKAVSFTSVSGFLPELIASTVVALVHLWRRSTLLSIVSGTVCYMLLVQLVF